MKFKCNKENSILIGRLESRIREGKVAHAYLFEGSCEADKLDFAKSFVKGILCPKGLGENCGECSMCNKVDHDNCEDITHIKREERSIKDKLIENMQKKLEFEPLGERHIVIIEDCDVMTARAQNRILKTLEEPRGNAVLILLSENRENLIQTILSRCVKYKLESPEAGLGDVKARNLLAKLLRKAPFYEINKELVTYTKEATKAEEILDCFETEIMKAIKEKDDSVSLSKFDDLYDSIHAIEEARCKIKQGMSVQYALKHLVLSITS